MYEPFDGDPGLLARNVVSPPYCLSLPSSLLSRGYIFFYVLVLIFVLEFSVTKKEVRGRKGDAGMHERGGY